MTSMRGPPLRGTLDRRQLHPRLLIRGQHRGATRSRSGSCHPRRATQAAHKPMTVKVLSRVSTSPRASALGSTTRSHPRHPHHHHKLQTQHQHRRLTSTREAAGRSKRCISHMSCCTARARRSRMVQAPTNSPSACQQTRALQMIGGDCPPRAAMHTERQ